MSDKPEVMKVVEGEDSSEGGSPKIGRWMMIGLGALGGFLVVGLLIAVLGSFADSAGVANFFRILRDFFIIVLALQGILIAISLVILILQVSALINLLSNEIKPIVDEARETLYTLRGTAEFTSKNIASPVIRTTSTLVGIRAFLVQLIGIKRNIEGR